MPETLAREVLLTRGWLSLQPPEFQSAVLAAGNVKRFAKGAAVYAVGDEAGGVYGIVRGVLTVSIAPGPTGPHIGNLANPGAWFGERPYLTGEPRMIGLEAAIDTLLFYLPLEAMERLSAENPANIRSFAQISLRNIEAAFQVINDLLIPNPRRRVAAALVRMISGEQTGMVYMSQSDIGTLTNTSRKITNRALNEFAARSWLRPGYGNIEILDGASLRSFAEEQLE